MSQPRRQLYYVQIYVVILILWLFNSRENLSDFG